ncbi:nucleolar protein 8 isoform X3 [Oncorhynchus keta]|uniref:nucleolar protein 8 isoform X3 n=1 Tax=Oncorhynchus keta TaxID=8018 RepID=UPI00227C4C46|nr:nucleolar protein 8 isoform X3 [Oncorhynchus keta]
MFISDRLIYLICYFTHLDFCLNFVQLVQLVKICQSEELVIMKRLYIGGLSHTITQKDLKDRFGKFGFVQDVELRTRRDDEGVPYKTFGYINLEITDAGFKKCMTVFLTVFVSLSGMTVLNKSKWKGETIQIEQARETFLQKLAQERHEAAEKIQSPSVNHKDKLVESMKEAGVENFHMKAAVPGTEIPGHKDWVVSKFGRVLPVLNLKCQGRNKFIKYDPSKHSHNIKKLESSAEVPDPTPVSQLTWEISGGDDDISKKRRGEFPPQKTPLAKKKKDRPNQVVANGQSDRVKSSEKGSTVLKSNGETRPPTKPKQTSKKLQAQTSVCVFDSGDDSGGDIRMLAQRSTPVDCPVVDEDEDNLEVVGDNYIPRTFLTQQKIKDVCQLPGGSSGKNEEDYDSADTDEILNSRKTPSGTKQDQLPKASKTQEKAEVNKQTNNLETDRTKGKKANKVLPKKAVKKVFPIKKTPSPENDSGDGEDDDSEDSYSSKAKRTYNVLPRKKAIEKSTTPSESDDDDDDDSEEESDSDSSKAQKTGKKVVSKKKTPPSALSSDDSESYEDTSEASADSEYEAMFTNCQRLAFSLDDLQQLVKESFLKGLDRDSDDDNPGSDSQQPGPNRVSEVLGMEPRVTASEAPVPLAKTGNGNTPEEILAAIFEEDNCDEVREKKKKKKKTNLSTSLPAFQGTKALLATSPQSLKRQVEEDGKMKTSTKKQKRDRLSKPSASEDDAKTVSKPSETKGTKTRPPSSSDSEDTTKSPALGRKTTSKAEPEKKSVPAASSTSSSSGCSSVESEMEEDVPAKKTQKAEVSKKPQTAGGVIDAKQQDNQKRLAAQEQRQKEAELQKKLIQEALAKLDSAADGNHHIKFSSDEEEDGDEEEHTSPVPPNPKKTLFQNSQSDEEDSSDEESPARGKPGLKNKGYKKLAGSNLFDDDDEEEEEEEKDGDRFQIKPQFEGKAGAKLMQLQSRFGTDERFQMDRRFIDDDDDDDDDEPGEAGEPGEPEMESSQPERECELVEEKKKSLDILNHLLNINVQPSDPNKPTAKGKTFRDISALQYDPTKEEHAAFETKNDKPKKDSKLARKKKREEAEKLPEVSREMYYDVSMDLKEVFGTSKEEKTEEEEENVAWDKEEEETSQPMAVDPVMASSHLSTNEGEASSGFKFSFFGGDTVAETTTEKEEYRFETLKGAKVSWQVDPRFQDSSDEEEEEEEEAKEQTDTTTPTEEPLASKKAFFFFRLDDERLKEGPKAFCRSSKLEDQREMWEEKRTGLIEEYRKKHKDARRKLKTSQRN